MNRTKRAYFTENTKSVDAEGVQIPGNRFLDEDVPTSDTYKRLIEGYANILESADKAKTDEQGLVKIVSSANAKAGNTPDEEFTYVAQIKNLPELKSVLQSIDTLINKELISITVEGTDNNIYKPKLSQTFLDWLNTSLSDIKSSILGLDIPDIQGITDTINSLSGSIDTLNNIVSEIGLRVDANETAIEDNATNISTNAANIQANADAIAAINVNDGRFLGEIAWRASTTPPNASWVKADGQAISRTTYADLFTLIGTTFGIGDGSTTFNVPNLEDKTLRGQSTNFALGSTGGSDSVTLAVNNLPEHTHDGATLSSDGSINLSNTAGTDTTTVAAGNGTTDNTLTTSTSITGSTDNNTTLATAVDTTTPYLSLVPFIKISN